MTDLVIDDDIDIFADPAHDDERDQRIKRELIGLRAQLPTMVRDAACEMMYPDMEEWCRRWKSLTVRDLIYLIYPLTSQIFYIELSRHVLGPRT